MPQPTPQGFTLIELLIVIALIGILISFSYPNYQEYLKQSRRTDGQVALLDLANRMETYYVEHHTYASATLAANNPETDLLPQTNSPGAWYNLSIETQDDNTFLLQAVPQRAQTNDIRCQTLTLNSLGEKGLMSGPLGPPTGTVETCW